MADALPKIAIIGASGHAMVIADIIERLGSFEIAAYLDDLNPERAGTLFLGVTVIGGLDQLDKLIAAGVKHAVVAIGNCGARRRIASRVRDAGFTLVSLVHPNACVARAVNLGTNSVVMAGAVVNPGCSIGNDVIINTGATVDHECAVGDGAHSSQLYGFRCSSQSG